MEALRDFKVDLILLFCSWKKCYSPFPEHCLVGQVLKPYLHPEMYLKPEISTERGETKISVTASPILLKKNLCVCVYVLVPVFVCVQICRHMWRAEILICFFLSHSPPNVFVTECHTELGTLQIHSARLAYP